MSSSNEKEKMEGNNYASSSTNNNKTVAVAASATKEQPTQKKKKPMIQHLLAGGTAGFVESSICHPLDTIKTRMQLRRQNVIKTRALSSLRDATDGVKDGALHRTSDNKSDNKVTTSTAASQTKKSETVRIKPIKATKSDVSSSSNSKGPLHDIGWKNRTVQPSKSAATTVTKSAVETIAETAAKSSTTTTAVAQDMNAVMAPLGPFGTARRIIEREGPLALYKGLTAVYTGIVPKMAIRFVSFEYYRDTFGGWYSSYAGTSANTTPPPGVTFLAGLLSGLTEAILVVTPAEVCKIRMQSQYHSLMDPSQMTHVKYKNVVQTAAVVVKEEGIGALYKGVVPTMLRQGCNQAVNFTVYNWSKKQIISWKRKKEEERVGHTVVGEVTLDHWQSLLLGGLSGGMGPLVNNPLGE